jgi:hypothetical protein
LRLGRTGEITGNVTLQGIAGEDSLIDKLAALQVPPETDLIEYPLLLSGDASSGQMCRLAIRAVGMRNGYPAVAETSVEIQIVNP